MTNLIEVTEKKQDTKIEKSYITGFGGLSKINKVKELGFQYLEKTDIKKWLDDNIKDNLVISDIEMMTNNIYDNYIEHQNDYDRSCTLKKLPKDNILPPKGDIVINKIIQNKLSLHNVGIKETKVEEYNEIPPAHIIALESKSTELAIFDEIKVLEPIKEDVEFYPIKDPILVWVLHNYPDLYFIIGVWDKNILLNDYLTNGTEKLIEESYKFFHEFPAYKEIGMNILGGTKSTKLLGVS